MRYEIVQLFNSLINSHINDIDSVAIVGGSREEVELSALPTHLRSNVVVFGIDNDSDEYLDLNKESSIERTFDLVLCSQVLEHIWNLDQAFSNLSKMLSSTGLLWVACPASNRAHGSPEYYSAGYQPELLSLVGEKYSLETISRGRLGSERCYFMTHGLSVWPGEQEHLHPIRKYQFSRLPGPRWKNYLRFCRDFPSRLFAIQKSPLIGDDIRYATETYVLFRRNANSRKSDGAKEQA